MAETRCEAISDEGDFCILGANHDGPHQRRRCDGTCDTCECDFWTDDEDSSPRSGARNG